MDHYFFDIYYRISEACKFIMIKDLWLKIVFFFFLYLPCHLNLNEIDFLYRSYIPQSLIDAALLQLR